MKETVVSQYFAWQACNKLHFGDIRKKEKGTNNGLFRTTLNKVWNE